MNIEEFIIIIEVILFLMGDSTTEKLLAFVGAIKKTCCINEARVCGWAMRERAVI